MTEKYSLFFSVDHELNKTPSGVCVTDIDFGKANANAINHRNIM